MFPFMDTNPIITPILKVRPRNNCGQYVILFIRGYIIKRKNEINPTVIAVLFKESNIASPPRHKRQNIVIASIELMAPLAKGLFDLLLTCLSRSLSNKSFITQPADLITTEPMANKTMVRRLLCISLNELKAANIPQKHGNISNINPLG